MRYLTPLLLQLGFFFGAFPSMLRNRKLSLASTWGMDGLKSAQVRVGGWYSSHSARATLPKRAIHEQCMRVKDLSHSLEQLWPGQHPSIVSDSGYVRYDTMHVLSLQNWYTDCCPNCPASSTLYQHRTAPCRVSYFTPCRRSRWCQGCTPGSSACARASVRKTTASTAAWLAAPQGC